MSRFFNVIRFSLNPFLQKQGCTVAKFVSISEYLAGMFYTISYIMHIGTMRVPKRGPALSMHIVNFPSKRAPILCKHTCIR